MTPAVRILLAHVEALVKDGASPHRPRSYSFALTPRDLCRGSSSAGDGSTILARLPVQEEAPVALLGPERLDPREEDGGLSLWHPEAYWERIARLSRRGSGREPHRKGRALALAAIDVDRSAVRFDDPARDREPETGPALLA